MALLSVCLPSMTGGISSAAICFSISSKVAISSAATMPFLLPISSFSTNVVRSSSIRSNSSFLSKRIPFNATPSFHYSTYSYSNSHLLSSSSSSRIASSSSSLQNSSYVRRSIIVPSTDALQLRKRYFSSKPPASSSSSSSNAVVPKAAFFSSPLQWYEQQNAEEWKQWVKDGAKHYWHGTKLFGLHTKFAISLLFNAAFRGKPLTRSNRRFLQIHAGDWLKMGPFIIIVIVPFLEFSLPFLLKLFPDMLPSTFNEQEREAEKRKKQLQIKLEAIKFLQDSTLLLSKTLQNSAHWENKDTLKQFDNILNQTREGKSNVSTDELMKYVHVFNEELTIDKLSKEILIALCRLLNIRIFGNESVLKYKLKTKLKNLKSDDKIIAAEGVDSLSLEELEEACRYRAIHYNPFIFTTSDYEDEKNIQIQKNKLKEWINLSTQQDVPIAFLLLSRIFSQTNKLEEGIAKVIEILPKEVIADAKLTAKTLAENETEAVKDVEKKARKVEEINESLEKRRQKVEEQLHQHQQKSQ